MDPVTGMLILGGLNAGMGAMKAQQAAKQRKMEADLRAAEIEASPWTGKAPSTQVTTQTLNPWAEMAGGAINAAGQAAALQNAGLLGDSSSASGMMSGADKKFSLWPDMPKYQQASFKNPFVASNE